MRVIEVNDLAEMALWVKDSRILLVDAAMSQSDRAWLADVLTC